MSRIDEIISDVAYILDILVAYRDIAHTGNCNNCGYKNCPYATKLGETVRYNCYYWRARNVKN